MRSQGNKGKTAFQEEKKEEHQSQEKDDRIAEKDRETERHCREK
jgi:hypothetical protein